MPIEGRICPYCLKPILDSSLKYYVRVREKEAWSETGSPLEKAFKHELQACRRDNHYKQFWTERLAEGMTGWDLENRLVVSKEKMEAVLKGEQPRKEGMHLKRGAAVSGKTLTDGRTAGEGKLLADGRLLTDGRTAAGARSGAAGGEQAGRKNGEAADAAASSGIGALRIVREGGQYKIYQGNILAADTKTVCENCWNVLPPQICSGDKKVIYISLVAGVGAGKSCLLLSWLRSVNENLQKAEDEIRVGLNSMPERYFFRSLMWDDLDFPKEYEDMLDRFINRDLCPKKTEPTFVPPVFLEVEYKEEKKKTQSALLCIYDAAGEVLTHVKVKNQNPVLMKHLEATDAVIFLVDPDDAGLKTNKTSRPYAYLEQIISSGDTSELFKGRISGHDEQARVQASPEASRKLAEIIEELLPEGKAPDEKALCDKNTKAAFLMLDGFLHNKEEGEGHLPGQETGVFRDKLMAFALSKCDAFRPYYEEESPSVFQDYEGKTGADRENFENARTDDVRDFFARFFNLQEIRARFPSHREFLLSALGCEARPVTIKTEDGKSVRNYTKLEGEYRPFRIEDPIYWILKEVLSAGGR